MVRLPLLVCQPMSPLFISAMEHGSQTVVRLPLLVCQKLSPLFICALEHEFSNCGTLTTTGLPTTVAITLHLLWSMVLKLWYAYRYWYANHCRHYFTSAMEHGSQTVVRSPLLICQPLFTITRLNKQPKRKNNKHF